MTKSFEENWPKMYELCPKKKIVKYLENYIFSFFESEKK